MTSSIEGFVRRVVEPEPHLVEALARHLDGHDGELVPEVFFEELTEWIDARSRDGEDNLAMAGVLDELEAGLAGDDADVEELIAAQFLAVLDDESPVLVLLSDEARQVRDQELHRQP